MLASNSRLQILTADDVIARFRALRSRQPVKYWAFYSSQLEGIVTDPALMVLPFDDHMVHRGHGIFDTAGLVDGKIYDLEAHLDRFLLSAERSKLRLPGSREEIRDIIVTTTAVSGQRNGSIRYWLSSGPGSLELSPAPGAEPGFFVMVFAGLSSQERWYTEGLRVMTTTYPIKAPLYAITKATNYLPNVLMQMEAKEAGFDNGVFIDADGHVGESSNMNVAFVTTDGRARPPEVRPHPLRLHIASAPGARRRATGSGPPQGRRGPRYSCGRRARLPRDAPPRQLGESGADRPMGRAGDWRRQAGTRCEGTPPPARGGHADERSTDRRALLTCTASDAGSPKLHFHHPGGWAVNGNP